jgi:hypothetical protein
MLLQKNNYLHLKNDVAELSPWGHAGVASLHEHVIDVAALNQSRRPNVL